MSEDPKAPGGHHFGEVGIIPNARIGRLIWKLGKLDEVLNYAKRVQNVELYNVLTDLRRASQTEPARALVSSTGTVRTPLKEIDGELTKTFSTTEVGDRLELSRRQVGNLVEDGLIEATKVGRNYRVTKTAIDEYLAAKAAQQKRNQ